MGFSGSQSVYGLSVILSCLLTACGSLSPTGQSLQLTAAAKNHVNEIEPISDAQVGTHLYLDQNTKNTRLSATVESGAGLLTKTVIVDPLVRPVSTIKALYGLVVIFTGGMIECAFINHVRFPALESKPIPALADAPAMDLVAWERDLDDIVNTKSSIGKIQFLIDGEAYFARLTEAIAGAGTTIDIRAYIFDNDDVSLQIADLLREKSSEVEVRILVDGLADLVLCNAECVAQPWRINKSNIVINRYIVVSRVVFANYYQINYSNRDCAQGLCTATN